MQYNNLNQGIKHRGFYTDKAICTHNPFNLVGASRALEPSTTIKRVDLEWLELLLLLTCLYALNNPERLCGTHPVENH
jgi:hypothetical protein